MRKTINILYTLFMAVLLLCTISSCKKFVQVSPPQNQVVAAVIFDDAGTATNAVLSIYGSFLTSAASSNANLYLSQSADELIGYANPPQINYYTNSLTATGNDDFWTSYYKVISRANAVLAGVETSPALTPALKQQLTGESVFVRAFFHFYLLNLFGDIPYISSNAYQDASNVSRMPVAQVYPLIIADLQQAKSLLTDSFPDANNQSGTERVRPNRGAAHAMLARVYLYTQDWKDAVLEADSVIANTGNYNLVTDLTQVFHMNSRETIWALQPSSPTNTNGFDGYQFILSQAPTLVRPVSISDQLYNAFEPNDLRKANWTGTFQTWHYPYKYRVSALQQPVSEYEMVLRLAEMYLIRAEASAQLNDLATATSDLNTIRARAGLPATTATTQANLLTAILHERQVELFTEWGHRWLDLKRTGAADAVLAPVKGSNWQTTDQLLPIPQNQLNLDPAMAGEQNPGYN